jgi:type I restriction-modification system DNA methylase subunit
MIPQTFAEAFERLKQLVELFRQNEQLYLGPGYDEATARKEFIDKFWIALGWDINYETQTNPYQQEVKVERRVTTNEMRKRADYGFLAPNFRDVRFFVEAKKPQTSLDNPLYYFQTIRYGWNSHVPLSVLTDFKELRILDCRYKPDIKTALGHAVLKYHYSDYADEQKFRTIYFLFSREAVLKGSLEDYAKGMPRISRKRPARGVARDAHQSIDEAFLTELDEYREELARAFKRKNPELESEELTEVTQRTLDRLVFMRFLEDKLIESEPLIENLHQRGKAWQNFINTSRRLDKIYNGIIFKEHALLDSAEFEVDERTFDKISQNLSHTESPYDFNAIPIHILGSIYERFLGKVIIATAKQARVEEKPEVRKAGGVYYTPEYIVSYIVDNTVGKLIEGKTPEEIRQMRFADIACGSGSFLLGVYDTLLRYHTTYYNRTKRTQNEGRKAGCLTTETGALRLSLLQKRTILLNNIYGVDIDPQAVEVAQLSLYLKLLEDETIASAHQQQLALREALLPSLSANIVSGNSLIERDPWENQLFDMSDERELNPLNFEVAFPQIAARQGFDAIVGNPPYIRIQTLQETSPKSVEYFGQHYAAASKGNYDIYVVFVERAIGLLNERGKLGYILPHKFFNAKYGEPLRALLSNHRLLNEIVHFGHEQVFAGASTYTCLMFLNKAATDQFRVIKVNDLKAWRDQGTAVEGTLSADSLTDSEWVLATGQGAALLAKLNLVSTKLADVTDRIFQGIKTSADKIFIVDELARKGEVVKIYSPEKSTEYSLESHLLHPLIKGGDSKRYYLAETKRLILFPYAGRNGGNVELISEKSFKSQYPLTWTYLVDNKRYLENRENGKMRGSHWYAYGRSQALDVMPLPKIFTPDIAAQSSFSMDDSGELFFTGGVAGGYGILPKPGYSRKFLLGLLNSKLLEWYIHQTATPMRGGWYSYESRFIRKLPIRLSDPSDKTFTECHDRVVQLVDQMLEAKKQLATARTERDKNFYESKCATLDRQIDNLVYELYDLTPEEISIVEAGN